MTQTQRRSVKKFLEGRRQDPSEFHSGGVLQTFETMEEDFKVDKSASMEDETHAKNEYNLAKAAREDAIDAAKSAQEEKETFLSDSQARKSDAEKEKQDQE